MCLDWLSFEGALDKHYKIIKFFYRSIEKARDAKMLDGYSVYVTKSVKPDQTQMKGKKDMDIFANMFLLLSIAPLFIDPLFRVLETVR